VVLYVIRISIRFPLRRKTNDQTLELIANGYVVTPEDDLSLCTSRRHVA